MRLRAAADEIRLKLPLAQREIVLLLDEHIAALRRGVAGHERIRVGLEADPVVEALSRDPPCPVARPEDASADRPQRVRVIALAHDLAEQLIRRAALRP